MTVRDAIRQAVRNIAARDVEIILARELAKDRSWLLAHPEAAIQAEVLASFWKKVRRRIEGEPLQYIIGEQEFFGLLLGVSPAVLVPRPETEHLVEAVLAWAKDRTSPMRIADVGTGSGAIALALAAHLSGAELVAIDVSPAALAVAKANAAKLGLDARIRFVEADLFGQGGEQYDVVISNPPYVPAGDASTMQREVVEHEPHTALFAGEDGLDVYRRLIPAAAEKLRRGGLLAMEIGYGQNEALKELLVSWKDVRFLADYSGVLRVVVAERT